MNKLLQTEEYQARVLWTQGRKGSSMGFTSERHTDNEMLWGRSEKTLSCRH